MTVTSTQIAGLPMVTLHGEVDHHSADILHAAVITPLTEPGRPRALLIDLSECRYIDSTALSAFLTATQLLPAEGMLGLIAPSENIRRLFHLTGLDTHHKVKIFQNREEALTCSSPAA